MVIRGKYILNNILGSPPPPPPPDVPLLDEAAVGTSASLRQQMETHRANAVCASCHNKMDPLGFGLENYDGIGKWRTMDGKFPVDASGTLPNGKTFSTPAEMRAAAHGPASRFRALHGGEDADILVRTRAGSERPAHRGGDRRATGRRPVIRFSRFIYEMVRSLPFQSRRGELSTSQNVAKPKEVALTREVDR